MIHIFHILFDKLHLDRSNKTGEILEQYDTGYDSIMEQIHYYRDKSIRDNTFYVTGSDYVEELVMQKYPPEIIQSVVLDQCIRIDQREPRIPLELGNYLYNLTRDPNIYLGIHRSYAIQGKNPLEDDILHSIVTEGLINNGAAMQGVVNNSPPAPSATLSPASDIMRLCGFLKSSYRGSSGALLLALPKDVVDRELEFSRDADRSSFYKKEGMIYTFPPEYIVGFLKEDNGSCRLYSREELIRDYEIKK